uniref:Uncharacterized protein n=1 Tax=Anguilla anguilla TaxID=7936 RepID=A0A0E9W867_ANGAN
MYCRCAVVQHNRVFKQVFWFSFVRPH